jgi:hypothetical protein
MDISTALSEAAEAAISAVPQDAPPPAPDEDDPSASGTPAPDDSPESGADGAEEEIPDEATEEETDDSPTLPEGYVAVPVVEDGLATDFVLKDAEGEVEIPALIVEYKANGKVRQDRLDQVVKLAQFGVYNQEREVRVKETEELIESVGGERDALFAQLEQLEAQFERVLRDEEYLDSVREAFERETSPERRAERAEHRAQQAQVAAELAPIVQQGQMFYEREIVPALELISQSLPTVTAEELSARMAYAMQLHVERAPNGASYIPASQYDAVRQYIVDDLAFWAQTQHARRSAGTTPPAQEAALQAELTKAQVSAQKAKRAVGQATKPVGRAASQTPAKPKAAKPATVDDALDSAMAEILAGIR